MNTIHETVFCNSPKNAALVTFLNLAGCAYQHKDLNEQYREYKKSALAATRNGQTIFNKKHYINDTITYR